MPVSYQQLYDTAIADDSHAAWKALAMRLWNARKPRKSKKSLPWPPPIVTALFDDETEVRMSIHEGEKTFWPVAERVVTYARNNRPGTTVKPELLCMEITDHAPTWYNPARLKSRAGTGSSA